MNNALAYIAVILSILLALFTFVSILILCDLRTLVDMTREGLARVDNIDLHVIDCADHLSDISRKK